MNAVVQADEVEERIRRSTERYYRETLGLPDWSRRTQLRMQRDFERAMFERLCQQVGSLQGKAVLDLGCGWGGIVLHAAQSAQSVVGIEPDVDRLVIALELVARSARNNASIIEGVGEAIPFPDGHFDVVASYQVLEHVRDPDRVIAEVHRVLRPGGVFHFNTPNYLSFREPHYKLPWLPLMPKPLARMYLRLHGRNPAFIDHVRYVNPISVRRMLRGHGFFVTDIHEERVRAKLDSLLARWLSRGQGRNLLHRWFSMAVCAPLRGFYLLFLNQDQEYVARKANMP